MKIDINQIPPEGLRLSEDLSSRELDLETEQVSFASPVKVVGGISRITNALTVHLSIKAEMRLTCSRCLKDLISDFSKEVEFNHPIGRGEKFVDLNPEIREEIILDYPIKPLCQADCKGLCAKCGGNMNGGKCICR